MSRFVVSPHTGLLVRGTIDIDARPVVHLGNGKIATVRSVSFGFSSKERTGKISIPAKVRASVRSFEILVPSVVGKAVVSDDAAIAHALGSGQHLGVFDTPAHATAYANVLHKEQARFYFAKKKRAIR